MSAPATQNGKGKGANSRGRKVGRPAIRMPVDGESYAALFLRPGSELKLRIIQAANEKGRSLNQEIISRLEQSFFLEDMLKARLISMRVPAAKPDRGD